MLVWAPRNYSRFVGRYGFPEDVLDSVYVPILLLYCCTRIQYFALVITLSDSGERMHRDKIPPQRMHAACHNVARGSCCAKRFAEFNGNCESYCSLEQLVASLSAVDEGNSAAGTYHPKTEGYIRRHLYKPSSLLYCGGCTWTRISRQPIIAITWHFSQQTLLEPLTMSGAPTSCFGERYRDVVYHNLDENNNTQTSKYRLLYSSTSCVNNSVTVCVCYMQFAGYTNIVCSYVESTLYDLLQMMIPLLLCRQQGEEPTKRHMGGCFSSAA